MKARSWIIVFSLMANPVCAQQCDKILTKGLRDYEITSESSSFLNATFSEYCRQSGESNASATEVGLDAVVHAIPLKFTLGSKDSRNAIDNFCKTYRGSQEENGTRSSYRETIVSKAYDTYVDCVQLTQLGLFVTHDLLSQEKAQLLLRAGVGRPIELNGIDTSSNISCYGANKGQEIRYTPYTKVVSDTTIGVFCTRSSREGQDRVKIFDEGTVALDVTGSKYNFYWPRSEELPEQLASQVQTSILELRNGLSEAKQQLKSQVNVVNKTQAADVAANTKVGGANPIWMTSDCPSGQVVQGLKFLLGGTARGALDADGRPVSTFSLSCAELKVR